MNKTLMAFLPALAIATAIAAVMPAAAQPAPAQTGGQCLRSNQIDSFTSIKGDQKAMIVLDRFRNRYKVSFNQTCDDVDYNGALAIRTLSNTGLDCVRRGDMVISRSVTGWTDRCVISNVQPYTAAMEQADREAAAQRR